MIYVIVSYPVLTQQVVALKRVGDASSRLVLPVVSLEARHRVGVLKRTGGAASRPERSDVSRPRLEHSRFHCSSFSESAKCGNKF